MHLIHFVRTADAWPPRALCAQLMTIDRPATLLDVLHAPLCNRCAASPEPAMVTMSPTHTFEGDTSQCEHQQPRQNQTKENLTK